MSPVEKKEVVRIAKEEGLIENEDRQLEILDFEKMNSISRKG